MCVYILVTNRNHVHLGHVYTTPTPQNMRLHVGHTSSPSQHPVQLWTVAVNSFLSHLAVLQLPFHSLSSRLCCVAGPSTTPPAFALLCTTAGPCHYHIEARTQSNRMETSNLLHAEYSVFIASIDEKCSLPMFPASPMIFQAA